MKIVMVSRWDGVRPGAAAALAQYSGETAEFWQRMKADGIVESRHEYTPMQHTGGLNVTVFPDQERYNALLADPEWMKLTATAGLLLPGYCWELYTPMEELPEGFLGWWFEKAMAVG